MYGSCEIYLSSADPFVPYLSTESDNMSDAYLANHFDEVRELEAEVKYLTQLMSK